MGLGIHLPAEHPEELEQPRVLMVLARAADVQEIRTGVGYRPMGRVEPTGPGATRSLHGYVPGSGNPFARLAPNRSARRPGVFYSRRLTHSWDLVGRPS